MLTVYNMQPNDDVRIGEMPHQLILYEIVDIELTFSMWVFISTEKTCFT